MTRVGADATHRIEHRALRPFEKLAEPRTVEQQHAGDPRLRIATTGTLHQKAHFGCRHLVAPLARVQEFEQSLVHRRIDRL